jgi:periplasmic mercuric ion binding protein
MKRILPLFLMLVTATACGGGRHDHSKSGSVSHAMISLPTVKCNLCAETVQNAVRKIEGVESVTVDLETKTAHVTFDSLKTSMGKIETAVSAAGYDANQTKRDENAYAKLPGCCQ